MNPLVDDKAPYALALLVTLLGWFLTSAVSDADKTLLVSYDVVPFVSDTKDYVNIVVRNQSLSLPLRNMDVMLVCEGVPCLTKANPVTRGAFAVANPTSQWLVQPNPISPPDTDTSVNLVFRPEIPARGELSIIVGRVADSPVPQVMFALPPASARTPEIERGYSIRGAIFANWFWVLLAGGAALALVVLGWIVLIQRQKEARP
jgi:hypothetical protein